MSGKSGPLNNHVQDVLKKKNQKTDKVSAILCPSPKYYLLLFNIDRLQNSRYFCVSSAHEQSNKSPGVRLKTENKTEERCHRHSILYTKCIF